MLVENARFGTATCLDMGDEFETNYYFELQDSPESLENIRVKIAKGDTIPRAISQDKYYAKPAAVKEVDTISVPP